MTDTDPSEQPLPASELVLYQTEDGQTRVQVRLEGGTVWLSQRLIGELFQVTVPTVNEHLRGIYEEGELDATPTIRKFRIVQKTKLDAFLRFNEREIRDHGGKVSMEVAKQQAVEEYERFDRQRSAAEATQEDDFDQVVKRLDKKGGEESR